MTPLERVAAKLAALHPAWRETPWASIGAETRELFLEDARDVLREIREPSEGMIEAAAETPGMKAASATMTLQQIRGYPLDPAAFADGSPLEQAWRAAIDAALSE